MRRHCLTAILRFLQISSGSPDILSSGRHLFLECTSSRALIQATMDVGLLTVTECVSTINASGKYTCGRCGVAGKHPMETGSILTATLQPLHLKEGQGTGVLPKIDTYTDRTGCVHMLPICLAPSLRARLTQRQSSQGSSQEF
jgi:hypothetical protein